VPRAQRLASLGCLLAVVAALAGCASSPEHEKPQRAAASHLPDPIGRVEVRIDPSLDEAARSAAIDKLAAPDKISTAVSDLLRTRGRLDTSAATTLQITITNFRLRSGASAFWLGAMAGPDRLAVDVRVEKNGASLTQYQTDTSSVLGGIAFAGMGHRFDRLVKTIAQRIVEGL
jgi:hypothetical protein